MTLSEGQLPFLSNLILSIKFCEFGFGLVMSKDKSRIPGISTFMVRKYSLLTNKILQLGTYQNWLGSREMPSERLPLKLTFNG